MTVPPPIASPPRVAKSVEVPLSPDAAFDVFTTRLGTWWPLATHSLSAGSGALPRSVRVEPRVGGQIVETKDDGSEAAWGRITAWQPGAGLAIAWHVGCPEDQASEVVVTFAAVPGGTRVDLTHRGFAGDTAMASAARYTMGWPLVLGEYARDCRSRTLTASHRQL